MTHIEEKAGGLLSPGRQNPASASAETSADGQLPSVDSVTAADPRKKAALPHHRSRLSKENAIALMALLGIALHLVLRYLLRSSQLAYHVPLFATLGLGGGPLVYDLAVKVSRRQFGSDLLAGISIVTSVVLGEYLAGSLGRGSRGSFQGGRSGLRTGASSGARLMRQSPTCRLWPQDWNV